jgi:hypothetical protein
MTVAVAPLQSHGLTTPQRAPKRTRRVMFRVAALYGLSRASVLMPLNETEFIESGQICVTIDPEADPASNVGLIDYDTHQLRVRYGIQAVFPGLYELVTAGKHDPSLLHPVRAIATDECTVSPDYSGWHAVGCLEFLPGSLWAGAEGG